MQDSALHADGKKIYLLNIKRIERMVESINSHASVQTRKGKGKHCPALGGYLSISKESDEGIGFLGTHQHGSVGKDTSSTIYNVNALCLLNCLIMSEVVAKRNGWSLFLRRDSDIHAQSDICVLLSSE